MYKILFNILYNWNSLNLVSKVVLKGSRYMVSQSSWDACVLLFTFYMKGVLAWVSYQRAKNLTHVEPFLGMKTKHMYRIREGSASRVFYMPKEMLIFLKE